MSSSVSNGEIYAENSILKILLKTAPPIMLAQLIQAMYNIVDSYFIGMYSQDGLTALSVIFPVQLLITGAAIGTGTGVNILMAHYYGVNDEKKAREAAGTGVLISFFLWAAISVVCLLFMKPFVNASSQSDNARHMAYIYGYIVGIGSLGIVSESIFTKILQAGGNMKRPMAAQIVGAVINIIFDPILIFGRFGLPEMGIAGAGAASVMGQFAAAFITGSKAFTKAPSLSDARYWTGRIFKLGYPSIIMQCLYTVYISLLNFILAGFCDEAVTVLGLYYKLQTFLYLPANGVVQGIRPIIGYNYGAKELDRVKKIFYTAMAIVAVIMVIGTVLCILLPDMLMSMFTQNSDTVLKGVNALRILCAGFVVSAVSVTATGALEGLGKGTLSLIISLLRYALLIIPIAYVLSILTGVTGVWHAFWITESITSVIAYIIFIRMLKYRL